MCSCAYTVFSLCKLMIVSTWDWISIFFFFLVQFIITKNGFVDIVYRVNLA